MKFGLKWVHMARYELILKKDEAIWLRIISGHPQKPRARFMEGEESAHEPQTQIASYTCSGRAGWKVPKVTI